MKKSELRKIVREEIQTQLEAKGPSKSFNKNVGDFQGLAKQKADIIYKMKKLVDRHNAGNTPPDYKKLITQHSKAIKKLNAKLDAAEDKFNKAIADIAWDEIDEV